MDTAPLNRTTDADTMHAAYVGKVNALLEAGRDGLAHELSEAYLEESGNAGRGNATAPTGSARAWLRRWDSYTLEVFNPGPPFRSRPDRSD